MGQPGRWLGSAVVRAPVSSSFGKMRPLFARYAAHRPWGHPGRRPGSAVARLNAQFVRKNALSLRRNVGSFRRIHRSRFALVIGFVSRKVLPSSTACKSRSSRHTPRQESCRAFSETYRSGLDDSVCPPREHWSAAGEALSTTACARRCTAAHRPSSPRHFDPPL